MIRVDSTDNDDNSGGVEFETGLLMRSLRRGSEGATNVSLTLSFENKNGECPYSSGRQQQEQSQEQRPQQLQ